MAEEREQSREEESRRKNDGSHEKEAKDADSKNVSISGSSTGRLNAPSATKITRTPQGSNPHSSAEVKLRGSRINLQGSENNLRGSAIKLQGSGIRLSPAGSREFPIVAGATQLGNQGAAGTVATVTYDTVQSSSPKAKRTWGALRSLLRIRSSLNPSTTMRVIEDKEQSQQTSSRELADTSAERPAVAFGSATDIDGVRRPREVALDDGALAAEVEEPVKLSRWQALKHAWFANARRVVSSGRSGGQSEGQRGEPGRGVHRDSTESIQFKEGEHKVRIRRKRSSARHRGSRILHDEPNNESHRRFLFDIRALRSGQAKAIDEPDAPLVNMHDIVDSDDWHAQCEISARLVPALFRSWPFRVLVNTSILLNFFLMAFRLLGIFNNNTAQNVFEVFEQAFFTVFVMDMLLKWYASFTTFWKNAINILDFFIIVVSLFQPQYSYVTTIKIFGLHYSMKSSKALMRINFFNRLTVLTTAIFNALPETIYIGVIFFVILTMLAVIGNYTFGRSCRDEFGDIGAAIFSLFTLTTQDGVFDLYYGLTKSLKSEWGNYTSIPQTDRDMKLFILQMLFFLSIAIGNFMIVNLVIAVVCAHAAEASKIQEAETLEDQEEKENRKRVGGLIYTEPIKEITKTRRVIPFEQIHRVNLLLTQKPLQHSDFTRLTTKKLTDYFLILAALEENLVEYQRITSDIRKICDLVKRLNKDDDEDVLENTTSPMNVQEQNQRPTNRFADSFNQAIL